VWRGWAEACPGLTHLDLSGNNFGGPIAGALPEQLALLPALRLPRGSLKTPVRM
jgi:hypothetical protein